MSTRMYEHDSVRDLQVLPQVRLLNHYVQRAKNVAISSIDPVVMDCCIGDKPVRAFRIRVEGPERNVRYFTRLIAHLKIHCNGNGSNNGELSA